MLFDRIEIDVEDNLRVVCATMGGIPQGKAC